MRVLTPSLITSYKLSGILGPHKPRLEDFSAFVDQTSGVMDVGVDLYLMMEPDVHQWCEFWGLPKMAAVDFLAELDNRTNDFCETLYSKLKQVGAEVVSTTSFVPEISNMRGKSEGSYENTSWGKALTAIFQIASFFQSHRPQAVVQMVAGSVLDQFRLTVKGDEQRFSVSTRERTSLIGLVLDRLSACLNAAKDKGVNTNRLRVALELEPGPLYLLQNKDCLEEFSKAIDDHECPLVNRCVGFNLDIAHWWLCRTLRTEKDVSKDIRNKIFGGHIAGHSPRGHFGDYGLTNLAKRAKRDHLAEEQLNAYQMWLRFLSDETKTPKAAGHVSLEFEAAKPHEDISSSLKLLKEWIDQAAKSVEC